ncbi:hypothetical protein SAMN04488067_10561 [Halorubrum xinjiangense]|uniref:Uncharacterized protein n=1 Tax=Halorubrum xinjiangense TaxID=261291 RepID=A0A1G7LQS6_9EURY|nr:hypothetical protein [Halorubrum xinjiangense]SDF51329.1 hypothetical protein SAMN04488067_10561 [Halorubrum xinjiangense]
MKALLLLVAGIGGLLEAVAPRRAVALWTRALYRNAGEAEPREWVYTAAKAEGALVAVGALVGLFRLATAEDETADAEATAVEETTANGRDGGE